MNTTYKENERIREIIRTILDSESLWGRTTRTEGLERMLEGVAEVSFIQGQFVGRKEVESTKIEKNTLADLNDYGQILKNSYNKLQEFLESEQRIK